MNRFLNSLWRILYPKGAVCIACGAFHTYGQTPLCEKCLKNLHRLRGPFCPHCGRPGWAMLCPDCCRENELELFTCVRSGYYYEGTGGALVRCLKYSGVRASVSPLISGMLKNFPEGAYHALVPVPLHPGRLRERGFNQSEILCQKLSKKTGIPVCNALERTRSTRSQARLSGEERRQNLKDAFSCTKDVRGCSLILVDDVITTGSTARACAQVLLSAGARDITLLSAARADIKPSV